ncbi:MAG: hypothetical protein ABIO02_02480 [Patescibacteria group bacterium]
MSQTDNSQPAFDFTHAFSKGIIILPLVVIVLTLAITAEQKIASIYSRLKPSPTPEAQVTPTSQQTVVPSLVTQNPSSTSSASTKLDLVGPYICNHTEGKKSATVYIKNKNFYATIVKQSSEKILVKGDCGYKWNPVAAVGEKTCGISQYFELMEAFGAMSGAGVDVKTMITSLSQSEDKDPLSEQFLNSLADSCTKKTVNDSLFVVPSGVSFHELSTADSAKSGLPF